VISLVRVEIAAAVQVEQNRRLVDEWIELDERTLQNEMHKAEDHDTVWILRCVLQIPTDLPRMHQTNNDNIAVRPQTPPLSLFT